MKKFFTDTRWLALLVLCLGSLMIVLDTTIVNVALPSIRVDLGFSETGLAWIVNAYLLTFGGFLLLGGRLGDLFGHRRLFLIGLFAFTLASLLCGIAWSQEVLIAARAIQGIGGAILSAVALSLTMTLFTEPAERARAMGIFGFVSAGGGSVGVLLGGLLTGAFDWHYIFLVNLPIGILVFVASILYLPKTHVEEVRPKLDIAGALLVTTASIVAVYAVVNGNEAGWTSFETIGLLTFAVLLIALFVFVESRVSAPLMPLGLFKNRNLAIANIAGVLWAAGMFAWFFISSLYLQLVLGYTPLQLGLAFLPSSLIMGVLSYEISGKLVMRYGIKKPLAVGLGLAAGGLLLLARAPIDGSFLLDILPAMIFLGIGAGIAFNPILLAAMQGVPPDESGLASGIVSTSFMMGGALGLAILASLASARSSNLLESGVGQVEALLGGYHLAFVVGAAFAFCAALLAVLFFRISDISSVQPNH